MAFTLPQFNLLANQWVGPNAPAIGAPDFVDVPCQLYIHSKGILPLSPGTSSQWHPGAYIRLQPGPVVPTELTDIFEVVPGSADYWFVRWVNRMHQGFPNEYWAALVTQCDAFGGLR